jgi:hypothetical protein
MRMVKAHDSRNHAIIEFVDGASTAHQGTLRRQLALHCIRFSSNNRDIHLLRGLDPRTVSEAAAYHDRAIKATTAAIYNCIEIDPTEELGNIPDERFNAHFLETWPMATQSFQNGGINIREWSKYSNAALLGKASLVLSTAKDTNNEEDGDASHYPCLHKATMNAANGEQRFPDHNSCPKGTLHYTWSLNQAWHDQRALHKEWETDRIPAWLENTNGNLRDIADAGERAQRLFSKTTTRSLKMEWQKKIKGQPFYERLLSRAKGAGVSHWRAQPWQEDGHLNLNADVSLVAYYFRFGIPVPKKWRGFTSSSIVDPDKWGYKIAAAVESTQAWNMAHNGVQKEVMRMLHDIEAINVRMEVQDWDVRDDDESKSHVKWPDVCATLPASGINVILEVGGCWAHLTTDKLYEPGEAADLKEKSKFADYKKAREAAKAKAKRDGKDPLTPDEVIALGFECTGALGKGFKAFIRQCARESQRCTVGADLYHWSSMNFINHWETRISVAIAKGLSFALTTEGQRARNSKPDVDKSETEIFGY